MKRTHDNRSTTKKDKTKINKRMLTRIPRIQELIVVTGYATVEQKVALVAVA